MSDLGLERGPAPFKQLDERPMSRDEMEDAVKTFRGRSLDGSFLGPPDDTDVEVGKPVRLESATTPQPAVVSTPPARRKRAPAKRAAAKRTA